ncbi:hypothetical protein FOZ63_006772, partial [Perkinsus olseni]
IVTENESVDGSSMSELDQSTVSVSSARSTRSVKSSKERRSRVSRKRSMRSIVSMAKLRESPTESPSGETFYTAKSSASSPRSSVGSSAAKPPTGRPSLRAMSGSQDFRPPPMSSNSSSNKRQASKHGSESREAERLRRRLESRKSMTNSVARILKRKNPQLEESILPDSEEEELASGRFSPVSSMASSVCGRRSSIESAGSAASDRGRPPLAPAGAPRKRTSQSSVSSTGSSRPDIPPLALSVSRGTAALKKPATVLGQESPRLFENRRTTRSSDSDDQPPSRSTGGATRSRWSS